ncbi:hypothetical protein [Salinibacterium sp. TMP30]|uniref:hypothetical protein n=1 Tax=Salinibacterium sp. TMP30 TaxID=3138237 RepID=UPI003139D1B7
MSAGIVGLRADRGWDLTLRVVGSGVTPFLIGASIKIINASALLSLSSRAVLCNSPIEPEAR